MTNFWWFTAKLKSHGLRLDVRPDADGGSRYVVHRELELENGRSVIELMTADEAERHGRSLIEYAAKVREANRASKLAEFRENSPVTSRTP